MMVSIPVTRGHDVAVALRHFFVIPAPPAADKAKTGRAGSAHGAARACAAAAPAGGGPLGPRAGGGNSYEACSQIRDGVRGRLGRVRSPAEGGPRTGRSVGSRSSLHVPPARSEPCAR